MSAIRWSARHAASSWPLAMGASSSISAAPCTAASPVASAHDPISSGLLPIAASQRLQELLILVGEANGHPDANRRRSGDNAAPF